MSSLLRAFFYYRVSHKESQYNRTGLGVSGACVKYRVDKVLGAMAIE